jgi:tetratricopeptide (TPR) repeat protein/transcriptional regulator with XRE-family HTH domain
MSSKSVSGRQGSTARSARRERDRLRRELIDRPVAEVADAMRIRFGDRPRRAFREAHGWSLQQVADRYNDIEGSGSAPMSKQRISEWELWPEAGKRRFSVTGLVILARVFQTTPGALLDESDLGHLPPKDLLAIGHPGAQHPADPQPATITASATAPASVPAVSDLPYPSLAPQPGPAAGALVTSGGALSADDGVAQVIAAAASEAFGFIRWAEAVNVGDHGIADLSAQVAMVSREHMHLPPLPTFTRARAIADQAAGMLREGRQRPSDAMDLYLIAGQAYGLMAWIAGDLGQHGPALTQARTAWLCAERASHAGLKAWTRAVQSKVAYWAGRIEDSATLARDGLNYPSSDSAPVLLACLHARALARLRQVPAALEALDEARRARDNVTRADLGGLYGFTLANQYHMQASTLLWLSEPVAALRQARQAIETYQGSAPEERFHGPLMIAHLDGTCAHLVLGEVDGALELSEPVLELEPELRLDAFAQRLASARELVRRPGVRGSAPARELAERIDWYSSLGGNAPRAISS